jgi:hypothetical protein
MLQNRLCCFDFEGFLTGAKGEGIVLYRRFTISPNNFGRVNLMVALPSNSNSDFANVDNVPSPTQQPSSRSIAVVSHKSHPTGTMASETTELLTTLGRLAASTSKIDESVQRIASALEQTSNSGRSPLTNDEKDEEIAFLKKYVKMRHTKDKSFEVYYI